METLAIIALVGNVLQFVEFSGKLIAKSTELYRSSEGALAENIDLETAASHLVLISTKIQDSATSVNDEALKRLCESCKSTTEELVAALDKVKVDGKKDRWKSIRKALRSVWSREKIYELDRRLSRIKEELNLHLVVDLREQLVRLESAQRDHLDSVGRGILDAVVKQQDVFSGLNDTQSAVIGTLHNEMAFQVKEEHQNTQRTIIDGAALSIQAEHAITRREIIQEIRSERNVYKPVQRTSCYSVPFLRNRHFVGRTSQLEQLDSCLFGENHTSRVAVIGLGGVGKTQIAIEFAYRTRDKWPECSVFWISATSAENVQQAYLGIAQQLNIPGLETNKSNLKELVKQHLSHENAGQWLLVLDNADDLEMWLEKTGNNANSVRLIDLLPRSEKGSIIFTTRSRKAATKFAPRNIIQVAEMDESIAAQVLRNSLANKEMLKDDAAMAQLLQLLTFLPLAIVQAAAYINQNDISIAEYLSLFDDYEENIIEVLSEDFEDEGRYHDIKNPIATTWLISFEQIRTHDALASDYLSFMSCIDPKAVPLSLLPPAQTKKREIDSIGTLVAYSFITKRPGEQCFDLHRLVHLATRNWLKEQNLLSEWTMRAIARLAEVFPNQDYQNRAVWRSYFPHAQYVQMTNIFQENFEENLDWIERFAHCLNNDGLWKEAENLFRRVMGTKTRVLGIEDPDTWCSMANLALSYDQQGRWKEAEDLEVQVLNKFKKALGEEHENTLICMANLIRTYMSQGRWKEAEELGDRVLETRKRVLGEEHIDTLSSMRNQAVTYENQGRWKEAEVLLIQVMETRKRLLGPEHPDTLVAMCSLASTYRSQGRLKEAEELDVRVLETSKMVLGEDDSNTLRRIANLLLQYWRQGRWKEAEALEANIVGRFKKVFGPEHPDTLTIINNLISAYSSQGKWKEAEEMGVQMVEKLKTVLGDEHPKTLDVLSSLALTYRRQGLWDKAEALQVLVMETRKRALGNEHPDTLSGMSGLALTYRKQGRWDAAEELEFTVLEVRKAKLGTDHPDTLDSMRNLGLTYLDRGRWTEAEELFTQVINIRKKEFRPEHPDMVDSMANLASAYKRQGRYKDAEDLELMVTETNKSVLGAEHRDTLSSISNLTSTYLYQGRWNEAEELVVQIAEMRKKALGPEHPDTLFTMSHLASLSRVQSRWKEAEELAIQCLETRKRVLGEGHPDTLRSIRELALAYYGQGRWKEAEDLQVQVLERFKRALGEEHPETLVVMRDLAFTLKLQNRDQEGVSLLQICLEGQRRVVGSLHPETESSLETLSKWQSEEAMLEKSNVA